MNRRNTLWCGLFGLKCFCMLQAALTTDDINHVNYLWGPQNHSQTSYKYKYWWGANLHTQIILHFLRPPTARDVLFCLDLWLSGMACLLTSERPHLRLLLRLNWIISIRFLFLGGPCTNSTWQLLFTSCHILPIHPACIKLFVGLWKYQNQTARRERRGKGSISSGQNTAGGTKQGPFGMWERSATLASFSWCYFMELTAVS